MENFSEKISVSELFGSEELSTKALEFQESKPMEVLTFTGQYNYDMTMSSENFDFLDKESPLSVNEEVAESEVTGRNAKESSKSGDSSSKLREKGCSCTKSYCLRLHCKCFGKNGMCSPECQCINCLNTKEFEEVREFVVEKTKQILPRAFQPRFITLQQDQQKVSLVGCKCVTGCQKKYCDCVKEGASCSAICRCSGCLNERVALDRGTVKKIFKSPKRRKHKLLFKLQGSQEGEVSQIIEFAKYKKVNSSPLLSSQASSAAIPDFSI